MAAADSDNESFGDWEEDVNADALDVKSLFDDGRFATIGEVIANDKAYVSALKSTFDLVDCVKLVGKDDMHIIMLVNFLRKSINAWQVANNGVAISAFLDDLMEAVAKKEFLLEENMTPTLADDALLFELKGFVYPDDDDEDEDSVDGESSSANGASSAASASASGGGEGKIAENVGNIDKIAELQAQLDQYRALVKELTKEDQEEPNEVDEGYFGSYSGSAIHESMLSDTIRTTSYRDAIMKNAAYFKDKVVLDVGCGTGILSMFAAKAGAKKVIAVDNSEMLNYAKKIVARNGLEGQIFCVKGKIEDNVIDDLLAPDENVDIVVSEWMGYGLYYENMLPSVIYARDRYTTKEDGIMMPSHSQIFLECLTASGKADRVNWWKNVYDFDMEDMQTMITSEAQVDIVDPEFVISDRKMVHELDLNIAQDEDLDFVVPFELNVNRAEPLRCICITFDVIFRDDGKFAHTETLSTSIQTEYTHWKHCSLWMTPQNVRTVAPGDKVVGSLNYLRQSGKSRGYIITLEWRVVSGGGSGGGAESEILKQQFHLS